jgi:hypothetical protein
VLALATGRFQLVPGRLVRGVADADLVERPQHLAVVGDRLGHGERRDLAMARCAERGQLHQLTGGPDRMRHEDAGVASRLGVDADDGLGVEVLGHVGDQPVLADDHDDVLGAEDEAGRVGPLDLGPPPRRRDRRRDHLQRLAQSRRPVRHLVDAAPAP